MTKTAQYYKTEAIKRAYGEMYDVLKPRYDGYVQVNNFNNNDLIGFCMHKSDYTDFDASKDSLLFVHKDLINLNDNNGWTRICSEEDLPTDDLESQYFIGYLMENYDFKQFKTPVSSTNIEYLYKQNQITHYRKINNNKPIW